MRPIKNKKYCSDDVFDREKVENNGVKGEGRDNTLSRVTDEAALL